MSVKFEKVTITAVCPVCDRSIKVIHGTWRSLEGNLVWYLDHHLPGPDCDKSCDGAFMYVEMPA